jgi:hypothetical protein
MKSRTLLTLISLAALLLLTLPSFATDEPPCDPFGTGTPGYWMNHPEAWPVDEITVGGIPYTKEEAIEIMEMPVKGDKTLTMFPALVAAMLNSRWELCNMDYCIMGVISCANKWFELYPVESGVKANSDAWQTNTLLHACPGGEKLYLLLDAYNNGLLCEKSRDFYEED